VAVRFGTPEWCAALEREINGSSEYRNAAARWGDGFNGNLLFAFEKDSALRESLHLLLRLSRGQCDGAEFVPGPSHPDATAILTGKLRVEGEKLTLLRHAGASRALIHCTASVDTEFPEP
jgi:putative sterol carrier protein